MVKYVVRDPSKLLTRRTFLAATAGGAAVAALGGPLVPARAAVAATRAPLAVFTRTIEVNGRAASVYGLAPAADARVARFTRDDRFAVTLENRLAEPTLVHWHGVTPPSAQDGVPGLSQPPLAPGERYDYDYRLTRAGTFWMHSHVGLQRQKLLMAPLIVADPADARRDEQEVVVVLTDFTFRDPAEILAELTHGRSMAGEGMHDMPMHHDMAKQAMPKPDMPKPDMSKPGGTSVASMAMEMHHGAMADMDHGHMDDAGGMAMDLNDVAFDAFLANERTLADPDVVRVEAGGRVRLRVINGAASTNFWLDLGGLEGELIAVDGDPVAPVRGKRFPLAMAQRLDIRLRLPKGAGAHPVLALREGETERTGIVLATPGAKLAKLAPAGKAATPALDFAFEHRLRAAAPLAVETAQRTLAVDLTGDMMDYRWGFGDRHGPLVVRKGERVELVLRNRTMMSHPMHLHGHHFQVVALGDKRFPGAVRDTVLVPPRASVTIAFDADNPGKWAFHCHNLYHMAAGMMTSVQYEV